MSRSVTVHRDGRSVSRLPRGWRPRASRRDQCQCRQPTSSIRIAWAPSHSARRPISRRRSCQPSSGTIDAKWLAASWPTFDDVVHAAVREEDLALADAARVHGEHAGGGMRGVVLVVDARPEVAVRDPHRLARPAAVDHLRLDRQHPPDGLDRLRRGRLPAGAKVQVTDLDPQRTHARRIAWPHSPAPGAPTISTHVLDTERGHARGRGPRHALPARRRHGARSA